MEKRAERFGYEVTINPLRGGDFFHASAAKALGIETQGLDSRPSTLDILPSILDKNLHSHQYYICCSNAQF